jgi:hypothetical protein
MPAICLALPVTSVASFPSACAAIAASHPTTKLQKENSSLLPLEMILDRSRHLKLIRLNLGVECDFHREAGLDERC